MSIRTKLTIMFLAIAFIPLLSVSVITFNNYERSLEATRLSQVEDLASLRANSIESYFAGLKSDVEMAQDFYNIKTNLPILIRFKDEPSGPEFSAAKDMLDKQLRKMQEVLKLSSIILVSPEGKIVYASEPGYFTNYFSKPLPDPEQKAFTEGAKGVYLSDLFSNKAEGGAIRMLVTAPAFDFERGFAGVIALEVDMAPVYKVINEVTGLGETGEILLGKVAGDQVMFLNPLRHDAKAALNRRVKIGETLGGPVQAAARGMVGSGQLIDYRGKKVIASWRHIPSLGWGMVAKIDTEEAFAEVARLRRIMILVFGIVFILVGLMAISIANSISRPIKILSKDAEIIGSGNLDYRVASNSKDEVGQLSRSFDKMTQNLKKVMASRDELDREVVERKAAEAKLKRSNENLEQFAYVASHDLQEPLRIMASYSQLLERRYKNKLDKDADEFIYFIVDAASRMQRLISDLLAYSRLRHAELPMAEIDCSKMLARVIDSMALTIEEAGAGITYDALPVVRGYEVNLMQLFQNLIGNAIKFHGSDKPSIYISAKNTGGEWLFSVKDNGIGIEPQYNDRIFMIFQRLHGKDEYPGTGIGLAICKKIVESHGGRIWVESEPDKGSTFHFTIPTGGR